MADPAYAAHQMRYYCETLNIGYSQPNRNNIYNGGEADCSSLVLRCCKDAGIPTGNAYSTRDMRREMIKAGWQVYNGVAATKASNLLPGDVLLAEGHHTCMYVGNGLIGEAAIDERGGIMGSAGGGQAGDQTGRETRVTALYSFPWTHVLRWPASASSSDERTDGYGVIPVNGQWTTRTAQRFRRVMNAWDYPEFFAVANLARYLNSAVPAASINTLIGKDQLPTDGAWTSDIYKVFQYWAWNWVPGMPECDVWQRFARGWTFNQFVDGVWGPATCAVFQEALNRSWANTGRLMAKP